MITYTKKAFPFVKNVVIKYSLKKINVVIVENLNSHQNQKFLYAKIADVLFFLKKNIVENAELQKIMILFRL